VATLSGCYTGAPFTASLCCQFRRLVDAQPTVLLVGNHDQHSQGQGGASLHLSQSSARSSVIAQTHHIQTRNGSIQVITLPWLTRSTY